VATSPRSGGLNDKPPLLGVLACDGDSHDIPSDGALMVRDICDICDIGVTSYSYIGLRGIGDGRGSCCDVCDIGDKDSRESENSRDRISDAGDGGHTA